MGLPTMYWQLAQGRGVLEFDEPFVELHWICRGDGLELVWWCNEAGDLLGVVPVAEA